MIDSATATPGISVARGSRRKRKMVPTTSAIVSIRVERTSATEARMVVVRSDTTLTWTDGGRAASSPGNSALMRSTVSITLAPAAGSTFRMIAGSRSNQPASWVLAGPIATAPISDIRMGAPLR